MAAVGSLSISTYGMVDTKDRRTLLQKIHTTAESKSTKKAFIT